ncbi:hypothetical protein [Nocardiopsis halophila]|uniref:hypothetical protein n=1 Tax=Nocardiopsis halophila TaxID=141692 RepID=UPI000345B859|nr:hypothetical protein [Nocardiopsis halophila]
MTPPRIGEHVHYVEEADPAGRCRPAAVIAVAGSGTAGRPLLDLLVLDYHLVHRYRVDHDPTGHAGTWHPLCP